MKNIKVGKCITQRYKIVEKPSKSSSNPYFVLDEESGFNFQCIIIPKDQLQRRYRPHSQQNKLKSLQWLIDGELEPTIRNRVNIWKSISHESILQVKQCVQTYSNFYVIYEIFSRQTLRQMINKSFFSIKKQKEIILAILTQIAEGVYQLQQKGFNHITISAEDIYINQQSTYFSVSEVVKLWDTRFGLARISYGFIQKDSQYIQYHPDCQFSKGCSTKCAVWHCGTVFYEIIEGRRLWQKQFGHQKIINDIVGFGETPEQLRSLIKGMLKNKKQERMEMKQVLQALKIVSQQKITV